MSFIIFSSVSLSKCYLCVCCPPVALFGSALWQHLPGLNRPDVFLAEWDSGAEPRAGLGGCVSSWGPGEVTLEKLGTLEAALTIVKQEVAQCCIEEGRQAWLASWKGRRRASHP